MSVLDEARAVVDAMPDLSVPMAARAEHVSVRGEHVEIPNRIYNRELASRAVERLNESQRRVAACVYSRHHDGHVREATCATLLASEEPWVVPYVVQLLGEYVVEISVLILDRLSAQSSFNSPGYSEFVRANSAFIAVTEQRAISYWSCYYRHDFSRDEYPPLVAIDRLRSGALA